MKIVGVIPARWASTRLPGKSLVQICGKPLIQRVVERVRLAKRLDTVLVATDDKRIADVVNALGVKAVMTRPDHPSGTDRIAEALEGIKADIVINIQGDEPLIDPKLIDSLAKVMASGSSTKSPWLRTSVITAAKTVFFFFASSFNAATSSLIVAGS